MLMVIFGAGASHDSLPKADIPRVEGSDRHKPPLARDLFANREQYGAAIEAFQQCVPVVQRIREMQRSKETVAIEEELERLRAEGTDNPDRLRHLAAVKYYLQRIMCESSSEWFKLSSGVNNYSRLIDALASRSDTEKVCLVTFNYDDLLERGCNAVVGFRPQTMDEYVKDRRFPVFKLHGSINWGRRYTGVDQRSSSDVSDFKSDLIDSVADMEFTDDFEVLDDLENVGKKGDALFPAIAIPVVAKTAESFECPPFHRELLGAMLSEIDKVLIIGWSGAEQHFLDMWLESRQDFENVRVQIVNGSEDHGDAVAQKLNQAGFKRLVVQCPNLGFTKYLQQDGLNDLFEQTHSVGRWAIRA